MFIPDLPVWTYIVTVLLPVMVALVTAKGAAKWWGAWVLALLTAALVVLTEAIDDPTWEIKPMVLKFLTLFTIAVATHFGFWKPVAVTGDDGKVRTTLPKGLG